VDCKFRSRQQNANGTEHKNAAPRQIVQESSSTLNYLFDHVYHWILSKMLSPPDQKMSLLEFGISNIKNENCMQHTESPHNTYCNTKCIRWFCKFSEPSNLWRTILRQIHHRNTLHGEQLLSKIQRLISLRNRQKRIPRAFAESVSTVRVELLGRATHTPLRWQIATFADRTRLKVEDMIIVKNALDKEK
jgi:hypothetical protein